jgi:hypothetical protein
LRARLTGLEESQRRTDALLERMNGTLNLLLAGYIGHDKRIVRIEKVKEGKWGI